jgi:cytidylate kinase
MKVLGAYEKARIYIEKHSKESDLASSRKIILNPGPTITISRESGIGATNICTKLIEYFKGKDVNGAQDWIYLDKDLISKIMEDHNLPSHFRKFLEEEKPPKLDAWFGEILGISPSKILLLNKTVKTIKQLAEYGNVIIVGRGANIILANHEKSFHVRLVAPLNYRIESTMILYNLDSKAASDFIKSEDEARKNYISKFFHKNIDEPHLYHAVININLLSPVEVAEMIGHCVIKRFMR